MDRDRGGLLAGRDRVGRRLGERRLMLAERLVIGLRPAPQDRAQRVADRPDVPAADPGALGEVDRHDLAGTGQPDVVDAVEVEVASLGDMQPPGVGVGEILGRDQVLVGREPHVADVDAAEEAVPVAVVRLAPVEVVERRASGRGRRPSHPPRPRSAASACGGR